MQTRTKNYLSLSFRCISGAAALSALPPSQEFLYLVWDAMLFPKTFTLHEIKIWDNSVPFPTLVKISPKTYIIFTRISNSNTIYQRLYFCMLRGISDSRSNN